MVGTVDGRIEKKEQDMVEKNKKIDRARGTSPAELRSSGPKQRPERVATMPGVEGESAGRSVPDNDNEYRCGGAYRAILAMFAKHLKK